MFGGKFLVFGKSHDPYHRIRHDLDFIRKRLVEGRAITLSDIILNHRPMETPELLATLPDGKQRSRRFRKHEPVFCPYAGWSLAFALVSLVRSRVDCLSCVSACYKEISPQFALRHLKKKHPEWKDEKSTEMNDKIYLFLLPGRRLRQKSDKKKPKNVSSIPTEPSITNPALTYVPSDPKARVQIVIGASVRTALASIPRATGPWINSFYEYMSTYRKGESIWSEYRTLVQRFLGFARLLRGMELEIKEDSEIDAEVGGLLDKKVFFFFFFSFFSFFLSLSLLLLVSLAHTHSQAIEEFRVFLMTGIHPAPQFNAIVKHRDAIICAAHWRVHRCETMSETKELKIAYDTQAEVTRAAFRVATKEAQKLARRRQTRK
jgi:hypothetical protein